MLGAGRLQRLDAGQEVHLIALRARLRLQGARHQVPRLLAGEQEEADAEGAQQHHQQPHGGARGQEEDQVEGHHQAVEHAGEGARGEDLAHRGVAPHPHDQVAGRALLEEGVGEVDEVIQKVERHPRVEMGAHVEQQERAQQRREEAEAHDRPQAGRHHPEELDVAARDHPVDQGADQQRHGEGEELHHPGGDDDPLEDVRMLAQQLEEAVPFAGLPLLRLEVLTRLEGEGHAGERAAQLVAADLPAPARRIDQLGAVRGQVLEDQEVVELPVQDRARREVLEVVDLLHLDAAPPQAEDPGGGEDGHGVRAVAAEAGDLAHLVELQVLAVVGQHHGEAGGAAVAGRVLLDERHALAPPREGELLQRREAPVERLLRGPQGLVRRHLRARLRHHRSPPAPRRTP